MSVQIKPEPDGNVLLEPQLDGKVKVTVTEQAGPAVTVTVSAVVDWRTFCRQAWPIVQSYTPGQRDGITDVLPPEGSET